MTACDLLFEIQQDSAGILITDPPWDLQGSGRFDACADYNRMSLDTILCDLSEAKKCLKPGAHAYIFAPAGGILYDIAQGIKTLGYEIIRTLAWNKGTRSGLGAYRNAWEPVIIASNGPSRGFVGPKCKYPSLLDQHAPTGRTAKPWQLYHTFLLMSSHAHELAIDPYCGTNPLEKAIRRMNRNQPWVASDILTPVQIADSVNNRPWRESGQIGQHGTYNRQTAEGQTQTRIWPRHS